MFLDKMIKPWRLSKIYRDHNIKRKRVIRKEVSASETLSKTHQMIELVRDSVQGALDDARKIIFVDEVILARAVALRVDYYIF